VPSAALVNERLILECLCNGADAVFLCETRDSKEAELVLQRVANVENKLEQAGIEKERVVLETLMLPMSSYLPELVGKYVGRIKSLGKLTTKARQALKNILIIYNIETLFMEPKR
jgi:coenzyme F420-reducing hydrogenase delta subunit